MQLAINPMVGTVTARFGYSAPLVCGTATLLLSAMSEFSYNLIHQTCLKRNVDALHFTYCDISSGQAQGPRLLQDKSKYKLIGQTVQFNV